MEAPTWSKRYLKAGDPERIAEAVRRAEATTSGEIVPMIVRRSSAIGHVPVLLATLLVATFFVVGGPAWQAEVLGDHGLWYLADVAVMLLLTAAGARLPAVQRWLTPPADQARQVEARALLAFYQSSIQRTTGATGVLIFVSLLERRAVVLADKAIDDQVSQDTWRQVCDGLVAGARAGSLGPALVDAVTACGAILTPHFPIQSGDVNELRNELVIEE
jgi:putative membrane protein